MKDCCVSVDYKYISGASEYFIAAHEIKNRTLPCCVAVSVIEGEYFVDFQNAAVSLGPGDTILIQSFVRHSVRMTERGKITHSHFLCSYATIDIFNLADVNYLVVQDTSIRELIDSLNRQDHKNEIVNKVCIDRLLSELILFLFKNNLIHPKKMRIDPWLNTTLQYIHSHIDKGITIEEVVPISGYSKTTFYKMFKSKMKLSPHEYIESERFKVATLLLLEGEKVKDVAQAAGFNDTTYFYKVFKRKYGITPTEYKRRMNYIRGETR